MRVIPLRAVFSWGCAWALTAWLLHAALPDALPGEGLKATSYALAAVMCLGYAALVPLPFAAIALDVSRRRHGASQAQDPIQHDPRRGSRSAVAGVAAAAAAAFVFWLGWPGEPAYLYYLRDKGWPATLEELDASYATPPDGTNVATKYLAVAHEAGVARDAFDLKSGGATDFDNGTTFASDNAYWLAQHSLDSDAGPLQPAAQEFIERYWGDVTSHVAPTLKQIAANSPAPSRYPIDLRDGFMVDLPHLAKLRALARELFMDTTYWSIQGNTDQAIDAALAILPLQESLANEPLLISQLVRIAILNIGFDSLEGLMNRTELTESDLELLQQRFAQALRPLNEVRMLDVALRGECAMGTAYVGQMFAETSFGDRFLPKRVDPAWIYRGLSLPPSAERMALLRFYSELLSGPIESPEFSAGEDGDCEGMFFFAPMSAVLAPGMGRAYEAEWRVRMQLEIAQAAIATERFRRAEGRLPSSLDELVPEYLAAVPKDLYGLNDERVHYLRGGDNRFTIYSIGRNRRDDGGLCQKQGRTSDDFVFSVGSVN